MSVEAPEKTGRKTPEPPATPPADPKPEGTDPKTPETPETATCGAPVTVKDGTKPCAKAPGHDGDHATRTRKTVKPLTIAASALALDGFGADETVEVLTEPGDRSELQLAVDGHVLGAHQQWVAAGGPKSFSAAVKAGVAKRYFIDPEERDAYVLLLDSAARLHGIRVRKLPVQKHTSGKYMIPWVAMDKRTAETAPAATADAGTPAA